jgi:hypothetical protein
MKRQYRLSHTRLSGQSMVSTRRSWVKILLALTILAGTWHYITSFQRIFASSDTTTTNTQGVSSYLSFREESIRLTNDKRRKQLLGPIFYNIFIPNESELQENAWRIVREQMQQRSWADPQSRLIYNLIGPKDATTTTSNLCENCEMHAQMETGNEVDTLQMLYDYCQQPNHENELVTYIHNKGSFHATEHNENTRRTATKSALDCRVEMSNRADVPYNACSGTLVILPQYLCKANMWTAKCSYIRNLLPPVGYAEDMDRFYNDTILHPELGNTKYACLQPIHWKENHLGTGRYAYERWVWSHPDVIPADVIPFKKINFTEFPPVWKPRLGRSLKGSPVRMGLDRGFGQSSFARLEGRLLEWKYLYHKEPGNSSWIWDYYEGYQTGTPAFKIRYCLGAR